MRKGSLNFSLLAIATTIVGFIVLLAVFFLLSPYKEGVDLVINKSRINILNIGLFYFAVFIFFTGLFSTIFFWFRNKTIIRDDLYLCATTSFRQGVLMSILICIFLLLQSLQLLVWWDILLVIGAIILIEMYLAVR